MNHFGNFGLGGREDGYVAVVFPPGTFDFPPVPLELQAFITVDEWQRRLTAISKLAHRYSRPLLEKFWIFFGFLLTFAAPIIVYRILADNLASNFESIEQRLSQQRLIAFGVFAAVMLVVWVPLVIWKSVGRYRMRTLIREWSQIDVLAKNKGLFVPTWTVALPSGYSTMTIVNITIPPRANPTVFHPDAYLPPYISPPEYNAGYGYNQKQGATSAGFQEVKI